MFSIQPKQEVIRLQEILTDYYQLAKCDPQKLRSLIPAQELWRFFVNGEDHRYGGLINNFICNLNVVITSNKSLVEVSQSTTDVSRKIDSKKDWKRTILRKKLSEWGWPHLSFDKAKSLTMANMVGLDRGWIPYEIRERGYLRAMYTAFQNVFECTESLTAEFIIKLHALACNNVKHTNYANKHLHETEKPGYFRKNSVYVGLASGGNLTKDGLLQLLKDFRKYQSFTIEHDDIKFMNVTYCHTKVKFFRTLIKYIERQNSCKSESSKDNGNLINNFNRNEVDKWLKQLKDPKSLKFFKLLFNKDNATIEDFSESIFQMISKYNEYSLYYVVDLLSEDTIRNRVNEIIAVYIKSTSTKPLDKIRDIVILVQSLEQLHPFLDANTRTFSMLLMNCLLVKNGMPPAILENPNKFSGCSTDELVVQVLNGMQNTLKLITEKKIYNIDSNELLEQLRKIPAMEKMAEYFDKIVETENKSRMKFGLTY